MWGLQGLYAHPPRATARVGELQESGAGDRGSLRTIEGLAAAGCTVASRPQDCLRADEGGGGVPEAGGQGAQQAPGVGDKWRGEEAEGGG